MTYFKDQKQYLKGSITIPHGVFAFVLDTLKQLLTVIVLAVLLFVFLELFSSLFPLLETIEQVTANQPGDLSTIADFKPTYFYAKAITALILGSFLIAFIHAYFDVKIIGTLRKKVTSFKTVSLLTLSYFVILAVCIVLFITQLYLIYDPLALAWLLMLLIFIGWYVFFLLRVSFTEPSVHINVKQLWGLIAKKGLYIYMWPWLLSGGAIFIGVSVLSFSLLGLYAPLMIILLWVLLEVWSTQYVIQLVPYISTHSVHSKNVRKKTGKNT